MCTGIECHHFSRVRFFPLKRDIRGWWSVGVESREIITHSIFSRIFSRLEKLPGIGESPISFLRLSLGHHLLS